MTSGGFNTSDGYPADYGTYIKMNVSNYYLHLFFDMTGAGYGQNLWFAHTTQPTISSGQHWIKVQVA